MNKQKVRSKSRGKTKKEKEKRKTKDSIFLKAQRKQKEIPPYYHHRQAIETIGEREREREREREGYTVVELEKSIPYLPSYNCREGMGTVAVRMNIAMME